VVHHGAKGGIMIVRLALGMVAGVALGYFIWGWPATSVRLIPGGRVVTPDVLPPLTFVGLDNY
jgi:hypothetical protein